jgi:predicted HicB family RNase H-like nuclease
VSDRHYTYRVIWSEEDREWVGTCAEFPSLSHLDPQSGAALCGIQALVDDVVADMEANGEAIPEPLSTKTYSGQFMTRVPPELHRRLAIEAAEEHVSLNRLVTSRLSAGTQVIRSPEPAAKQRTSRKKPHLEPA